MAQMCLVSAPATGTSAELVMCELDEYHQGWNMSQVGTSPTVCHRLRWALLRPFATSRVHCSSCGTVELRHSGTRYKSKPSQLCGARHWKGLPVSVDILAAFSYEPRYAVVALRAARSGRATDTRKQGRVCQCEAVKVVLGACYCSSIACRYGPLVANMASLYVCTG